MVRGEGRKHRKAGTFGSVDELPTGRIRARYYGPNGRRYSAPTYFLTQQDARAWLSTVQSDIIRKRWQPPDIEVPPDTRLLFGDYAERWIKERELEERTRGDYRDWLDAHILPALGEYPIASIDEDDIKRWFAKLNPDTPTLRARVYGLCSTIFNTAVDDPKVPLKRNPCRIKGAGTVKRARIIRPATLGELETIVSTLPKRFRLMALLATWCALRFGELTELRRKDIDLGRRRVYVERGVVRLKSEEKGVAVRKVKAPKSEAGIREVSIPPHLVSVIENHLRDHVDAGPNALLFPASHGGHLAPSTFTRHWYRACRVAGRWAEADTVDPRDEGRADLTLHDLRHTGAVLAALTGATLKELMDRLGHSTPGAAMRYQHAAQDRDTAIAVALSKFTEQESGNATNSNTRAKAVQSRRSRPIGTTSRRRPRI
ncbi:site-specific integrase [Nocardia sp. NBC_01503]|uniref:tyrosine-type recombinase/integrase n=1 Tax=Nocardia sp. NBC_01503 TaxID=2975997 RepID=UPI002E7BB2FD|nr:site-specific integrase [Nocardia sp. NBC_01503]WTL30135.1 site-specific integrase [Nocardia sp. NBC_01503]